MRTSLHPFSRYVLGFPLVSLPLLIGGARPWLWASVAAVFLVGLVVLQWTDPSLFERKVHGRWVWGLGLLLIWPILQIFPISQEWLEALSPQRLVWLQGVEEVIGHDVTAASISWDPLTTLMGEFFWLFLVAFAWLFWLSAKEEGRLSWFWNLLFLLAGLEALYGLIQVLIPRVGVFWLATDSYRGMARGTFINKNHYAAFLGMIWPVLLARVSSFEKERRKGARQKQLFFSLIIGFILLAVLFSQSRGAGVGVLIAMTVFALVGRTRRKGILALVVGLWMVVFSYGTIIGFEAVLQRFDTIEKDAPGRLQVWKDTLHIIRDYPWAGTGLGTYPKIIRVYQTSLPANQQYGHAHGDYLELASELGLPVALVMIMLVWGYWGIVAKRLLCSHKAVSFGQEESAAGASRKALEGQGERRLLAVGALAGSASFLCHAVVEFGWQIPANQLVFVTLLVLMRLGSDQRDAVRNG